MERSGVRFRNYFIPLKTNRETTMAISMASWIIIIKQKKDNWFNFIRFLTFSHLELNII